MRWPSSEAWTIAIGMCARAKRNQKYSPKAVVGRSRLLEQVTRPSVVKNAQDVELALVVWRKKCRLLAAVFGERFPDTRSVAYVIAMLLALAQAYAHVPAQGLWDLEMPREGPRLVRHQVRFADACASRCH